jgi:hypothetical protein
LFRLACEYLVSSRIVRPGVVNLLEHVATARARAREETWTRTEHLLTEQGRTELDGLLDPDPELGRTRLSWLSIGPTSATPAAVKAELEKLAYLRRMDAHTLDVSVLPAERRRFPAQVGRWLTAQALSRREAQPRQTARYLLASSVPDNWIPLLPVQLQPAPGTVISRLKRGAVLQPDGTHKPHLAQSQVLNVAADVLFYDEDVPREDTHITRTRNVARWIDGSTCAWTAFRKRVGRGEGSSGLRFDQLQE